MHTREAPALSAKHLEQHRRSWGRINTMFSQQEKHQDDESRVVQANLVRTQTKTAVWNFKIKNKTTWLWNQIAQTKQIYYGFLQSKHGFEGNLILEWFQAIGMERETEKAVYVSRSGDLFPMCILGLPSEPVSQMIEDCDSSLANICGVSTIPTHFRFLSVYLVNK